MSLKEQFLKEGSYLRGWSPRTLRTYRQALVQIPELPTKAELDAWVVGMRERGLTPGGCNMYIRTVNSYLSWLSEQHQQPSLKLRLLPNPSKPLTLFSDEEIRSLLSFRPKTFTQKRTWTLILTLLDTGTRIEEALTIRTPELHMEALWVKIRGKGNKERVVPFSPELRKHLFKYGILREKHSIDSLHYFCTRHGLRLSYRNTYRQIKELCLKAGVSGEHVHPHNFRHHFSVNYIRQGGDVYRLSRILGHSSISTSQLYLRSMGIEIIQESHRSVLSQK